MENKVIFIEPLLERAEEYGRTSYELFKLKTLDKTTDLASTFFSRGIILLSFFAFLFIVNIGLALWIGDLLGKSYYGFFCVSGFYGLAGIIFYLLRDRIKRSFGDSIVSQILNK